MALGERIDADLAAAMKARDAARTSALRLAKAALKNKEIDKRAPLDEAEGARVIRGLVKQCEEAIEQFTKANRRELADKERAEMDLLRTYLPPEASGADIAAAVERAVGETGGASLKDMGKVMKAALAALEEAGKPADGRRVSEAVRKRLGG